jgi:hypothetical protein
MRVAFWGAGRGCGTTTSMMAVAGYCALGLGKQSICVQPKTGIGDLELLFRPWEKRNTMKEESTYYAMEGMDYLIWQEQNHRLDGASLQESLIPLMDCRLFYLPGGAREKSTLYPVQTGEVQSRILEQIEKLAGLLFIDLGCGQDEFTSRMLRSADLVVINFSGEGKELENFFSHVRVCWERVLYVLDNYQCEQVYNRENMSRIYRMEPKDIYCIPANARFAAACEKGRLEQFLRRNCMGRAAWDNRQFVKSLEQIAGRILEGRAIEG